METRREKKNIMLKIPRSQWINRKNKMLSSRIKAVLKKIKLK